MDTLFLAANNGIGNMGTIIAFIVLIALMYFMMIKPQKKQQQKKAEMMNQLKKGDSVILIDGLHGKIDSVNTKDNTVIIDADGIYLTFSRMAVQQILPVNSSDNENSINESESSEGESEKISAASEDISEKSPADDSSTKE
ncbi:preprotein translocase subunit YajC [Lactobacillus bombicola]|uniref:Preprotein translocase subunit YajC n=1 Tax=Lactobacillus bombicola TaxID=1505723 RepID=A0ABX9LW17_9LACO|nr:preprotein translocase subunit YajC [Lactobacillus bombicola]RHW51468.1 preprotein translocase subunit YajC [Lactobacillus bombicola]